MKTDSVSQASQTREVQNRKPKQSEESKPTEPPKDRVDRPTHETESAGDSQLNLKTLKENYEPGAPQTDPEKEPLEAAIRATEGEDTVMGEKARHVAAAFQGLTTGDKQSAWAKPYLENMGRLAWQKEYGQGQELSAAPPEYVNSWIDAWSGGDQNVPLAQGLNAQMNALGARSPEQGGAYDWKQVYGPDKLAPAQRTSNDCGVTASIAMLRATGQDADQAAVLQDAIARGFHSGPGGEWAGPYSMPRYLQTYGVDASAAPADWSVIDQNLADGKPVVLSTNMHYFVLTGKDDQGRYNTSTTGPALRGRGQYWSQDELKNFSGGHTMITLNSMEHGPSRPPATEVAPGRPTNPRSVEGPPTANPAAPGAQTPSSGNASYTVKPGDTLWDIAQRNGTTYQEIARLNNISNPDLIYPDQVFQLPGRNGNASQPMPRLPLAPSGANQPLGPIDHSSNEGFVKSVLPYARQVEAETGIPAAITVSMAINETGYGKYAAGNNFFGIKADPSWQGPTTGSVGTWEDYGNGPVQTRATFRAYDDPADSFRDFGRFLQENPRYADALAVKSDPVAFINAIKAAGYATDSEYPQKILAIARTWDLL